MRPPSFWFTAPDALSTEARILRPLGRLYAAATAFRLRRPGMRATVPVICVGNLNAGGSGKTPTVQALLSRLKARGVKAHVVSRGHGGKLTGPVLVDPMRHDPADTGDEPLLLARQAPVWVAKNRAAGAIAAATSGADAIILDDGFQNPALLKDLSIVVVDAGRGFGNGLCLPAGPLREPVSTGLGRGDLLLSIGDRTAQETFRNRWGPLNPLPHLTGQLIPVTEGTEWNGLRVLAFAGIGYPDKFFASLRSIGARIVRTEALSDHQPLLPPLLARLEEEAHSLGAMLATTEKDAARLPPAFRGRVLVLPVRLALNNPEPLDHALDRIGC